MKTYFVYFQVQVDAVDEKGAMVAGRECLAQHNDSICNAKVTVTEYAPTKNEPKPTRPRYRVK